MTDLTPLEAHTLNQLGDGWTPTRHLHPYALSRLIAAGYIDHKPWAQRVRLTDKGRELYKVQGVGA